MTAPPTPRAPRAHWLVFLLVTAACFAGVVWAFWPGYMSYDSFRQLAEARSGEFSDWHPPVMSAVWRLLDRLVPGPSGMLVLHNAMFFVGLSLLLAARLRPLAAAAAMVAFAAVPSVTGLLSTVWKDVGLGASLTLAVGLLLWAAERRSWAALWASLLPLAYGTAVRHEALFASVPLALWWGAVFLERRSIRATLKTSLAVGGVVTLGLLATPPLIARLMRCAPTYPAQQLFLQDLIGISKARGENLLPAFWRDHPSAPPFAQLKSQYNYETNVITLRGVPLTLDPAVERELALTWALQVATNPGQYLKQRWLLARAQLGFHHETRYPFHDGVDGFEPKVTFIPSAPNRPVMKYLEFFKNSLFFRAWLWLFLALAAGVARSARRGAEMPAIGVCASAWAYALIHLVVSTVTDFRLIWWSVVGAMLTLILVASRPRPPPAPASEPIASPVAGRA